MAVLGCASQLCGQNSGWGKGRELWSEQRRSEPCQVPSRGLISVISKGFWKTVQGDSIMKMRLPGTPADEIGSFCRVLQLTGNAGVPVRRSRTQLKPGKEQSPF